MKHLALAGLIGGINFRSAIWGGYVTKGYAEKHPDTTVKETKKVKVRVTSKTHEPMPHPGKVFIRVKGK